MNHYGHAAWRIASASRVALSFFSLTLLLFAGPSSGLLAQGNPSGGNSGQNAGGQNGQGGGAQADFDTLIDMIETTIAPDTWETVGGDGSIEGFPGGVYVNARGLLAPLPVDSTTSLKQGLRPARSAIRERWAEEPLHETSDVRQVSLTALFGAAAEQLRAGEPLDDAIRYVGGLTRLDMVAFEDGDVVLVGPAGGWSLDEVGRVVGQENRPVLRFDDLVVLLGNAANNKGVFVCSITPTQRGLERAQQFATNSAQRSIKPGQRPAWLTGFRKALGNQRIEVTGVPATTRVSRVIVEADYHMKRVGIGLEPSTPNLSNYLQRMVDSGRVPQSIDVLRWWFTLHPNAVTRVEDSVFAFNEQVTRVMSENEFLAARGRRVHTGRSHQLNEQFARDFTRELPLLAESYPVYAELDNVFRLALLANLVWQAAEQGHMDFQFRDWMTETGYRPEAARAPNFVASVANDVTVDASNFLAAVSGGVEFRSPRLASIADSGDIFLATRAKQIERPLELWWSDRRASNSRRVPNE